MDKSAADLPDYPADWTAQQRVAAYYAGLRWGFPAYTNGWISLLNAAERKHDHIQGVISQEAFDL